MKLAPRGGGGKGGSYEEKSPPSPKPPWPASLISINPHPAGVRALLKGLSDSTTAPPFGRPTTFFTISPSAAQRLMSALQEPSLQAAHHLRRFSYFSLTSQERFADRLGFDFRPNHDP